MFFKPLLNKNDCLPDGGALTIRIGENIILDAGSFVSMVPKSEQQKITDIFLTHAHLDHCKDLGFLAENVFNVYEQTINVRGTKKTIQNIQNHIFNNEIWPDFTKLPEGKNPIMRFVEFKEGEDIKVGEFTIKPVSVNHVEGAVGFVASGPDGHVAVTGDTASTEEIWNVVNELKGETTVFIETSFPEKLVDVAEQALHLTPERLKTELKKIKRADVSILIYHIKMSYYSEIVKEIELIGDRRVKILGR